MRESSSDPAPPVKARILMGTLRCDNGHAKAGRRSVAACGLKSHASRSEDRLPSTTFVAIWAKTVISPLKTWVSAHTLKAVLVHWECRFAWQ